MENVEVPLIYANISRAERHRMAQEVLEKVGLGDKLKNLPTSSPAASSSMCPLPVLWCATRRSSSPTNHRRSGLPHWPRGHRDAPAAPQGGAYRGAHHPRQFHRRAGGAYHRLEDGQVVYDGDAHAPELSCSPLCPAKRHRRKQNNGIRDFPPGTAERLEQ